MITRVKINTGLLCLFIFTSFSLFIPVTPLAAQDDDVIMVVNDREITKAEFIRLWKKHNLYEEPPPVDDYLELFTIFHLKLAHARDEGIHLETSFKDDLAGYRRELAIPYLVDPDMEEKLVKEAYERLLYDVNASHILVRLSPGHSPDDTIKAREKALQIRNRIIKGESFEKVASATSDDPSAKINSGNLGYFTVFQMVYPFENYVYNAGPGVLSMPVRTRFGYHIIKINDIRESRGEIKTAHIMIGFDQYSEEDAKNKSAGIYEDIIAGSSFEQMAKDHSTDVNTASRGGELPWFGSGSIVPEFETAAFALEKPGDISEPVRTKYGWHIIKLKDQRDIPPFDEIKNELVERIRGARDERSIKIKDALVEKLKKEWAFSENTGALEIFYNLVDERIFDGNWTVPASWNLNRVLFRVTGAAVTQRDFAEFLSENAYKRKPWPVDEYIYNIYSEYVKKWLINHENRNLENKYPEFRFMMKEYKDGMLLFEITDRKLWSGAHTDSVQLAEFHERNKHNYMWGKRISASIYTTENRWIAKRASTRSAISMRFNFIGHDWIINLLERRSDKYDITVEKGLFSRGDNHLTDRFEWNESISEVIHENDQYHIVLIHEVLDPEPKTLDEAREQVVADYHEYLEQEWIKDLRSKYNVVINKDVLQTIN